MDRIRDHQQKIYCDSAAAMPLLPEVRAWLQSTLQEESNIGWAANLSSDHAIAHSYQEQFEKHTMELFQKIRCSPAEWFWTSGATESNTWAIQIALDSLPHLDCIAVHPLAHPSLALAARNMAVQRGKRYVEIPLVREEGYRIDLESLNAQIDLERTLVAIPYGDHELGSFEPLTIALKSAGWLHFDGAQSFAKIEGDFSQWPCTSWACSSGKIGALSGVGGLFVRLRPKKNIQPIFLGGSQQNNMRAGTLPYLSIISFCVAFQAWKSQNYGKKLIALRDAIQGKICEQTGFIWHSLKSGLPHIGTFEVPEGREDCIKSLKKNLAFSQGSACQKGQGSSALSAVGFELKRQRLMVRLGFSPYNLVQHDVIWEVLHKNFKIGL